VRRALSDEKDGYSGSEMKVLRIYYKLLKHFGRQYWWPAETSFEMITEFFDRSSVLCSLRFLPTIFNVYKPILATMEY